MANGIDPTIGHDQATRLMAAAKDRPVEGEDARITAARGLVRDHERDPRDGTVRTFGGRDEGRLVSALTRIDPESRDAADIGGRLSADVAIQRLGAQRERELSAGGASKGFERRDRDALHGDVSVVAGEGSRFTAGALAAGRFEQAHVDMRKWVQDSTSFAGREAAARNRDGVGDRMASIGGFRSGSSADPERASDARAQQAAGFVPRPTALDARAREREAGRPASGGIAAQAERLARGGSKDGRPPVGGKGGPQGPSVVEQARFLDRSGRGR